MHRSRSLRSGFRRLPDKRPEVLALVLIFMEPWCATRICWHTRFRGGWQESSPTYCSLLARCRTWALYRCIQAPPDGCFSDQRSSSQQIMTCLSSHWLLQTMREVALAVFSYSQRQKGALASPTKTLRTGPLLPAPHVSCALLDQ